MKSNNRGVRKKILPGGVELWENTAEQQNVKKRDEEIREMKRKLREKFSPYINMLNAMGFPPEEAEKMIAKSTREQRNKFLGEAKKYAVFKKRGPLTKEEAERIFEKD